MKKIEYKLVNTQNISIRSRLLKDGTKRLYFDIYKDKDRIAEFPISLDGSKLFLYPDGEDIANKNHNEEVIIYINKLAQDRQVEISANKTILKNMVLPTHETIRATIEKLIKTKTTPNTKKSYENLLTHLTRFKRDNYSLISLNNQYFKDFKAYLIQRKLHNNTIRYYYAMLKAVLTDSKEIYKDLPEITAKVNIKSIEEPITFLTLQEIQRLESIDFNRFIKRPFLFSCYCGLRYSDIKQLKYRNVSDGIISITIKKTGSTYTQKLNSKALELIGTGKPDEYIFKKLPANPGRDLSKWLTPAGITKEVTFHTARHSFACNLLIKGVDIYTVSKLLGHTDVKTTVKYLRAIGNTQAEEAVNLLN